LRSKSGPGGNFSQYGFCELAQRQAVLLRKDKPSDRDIKSDRAKVVMTAGCLSESCEVWLYKSEFAKIILTTTHSCAILNPSVACT